MTVKLPAEQKAAWESRAAELGLNLSEFVRTLVEPTYDGAYTGNTPQDTITSTVVKEWMDDFANQLESVDRRLGRLEEMAGL